MPKSLRRSVLWDDCGLGPEPRWMSEPSIAAIKTVCQRVLQLDDSNRCTVSFLAAGAFNKLYLVEDNQNNKHVMRVSLPVDPQRKTYGEVSTLQWLRTTTDIPVSKVLAFNDSNNDEIGFEWVLMDFIPGTTAYHRWRKLSFETKTALVQKIAEYQAQLINISNFRTIGTLKKNGASIDSHPIPDQMVSRMFFWGQHFDYEIPRGPFRSSHDWLESFISIIVQDQTRDIDEAEDEDEKEDAQDNLRVAQMLAQLLPKIFPSIMNPPERTVLWHDDLSLSNVMIDDKGSINAVIDWECISAMPLWAATQMPKFLRGANRSEEPVRDQYGDETPEDVAARQEFDADNGLDSEGKTELYWIHLMEYEQTKLRKVYSDCMAKNWSGWDDAVADSVLKVDFFGALVRCADGFNLKGIEAWVNAINKGEFPRLAEMLRPRRT